MVILGGVYKDECPTNSLIPIWLIVAGAFSIVAQVLGSVIFLYSLFRTFRQRKLFEKLVYMFCLIFPFILVLIFNVAWFFTGTDLMSIF